MAFKIEAAMRIKAAKGNAIDNAIDWIANYLADSQNIQAQYLKPKFVIQLLKPLVAVVPYVPINKQLYHLTGNSDKPLTPVVNLHSDLVTSYTYLTKPEDWTDIAESIGVDNHIHYGMYKVESQIHEIFNCRWLATKVLPYVKKHHSDAAELLLFEEVASDWQGEVVGYSPGTVKTTLVKDMSDEWN